MGESLLTLFRRNALKFGESPCFHTKAENVWKTLSWIDAEEFVRRHALGLAASGVKPGDRVALLGSTCVEWTLMDLAVLACHGVTVPIYATLNPDQVAYICRDAGVRLFLVEDERHYERVRSALSPLKIPVVALKGTVEGGLSLADLVNAGKSFPVNRYDETLKRIEPEDLATVVYTSGTTGLPKGAMITHRNILAEVEGLQGVFHFRRDEIGMMCLPLAHVIARAMQFYQLAQGCQAAYAQNLDLLSVNLREVRPHFMAGVPRLFEKAHEKIMKQVREGAEWKRKLFNWSLNVGYRVSEKVQKKISLPLFLRLKYLLARLLVFRKIHKGFGGRVVCFISGGAPLSKEIGRFFHASGMVILEGYGLTETFAAVALNRPDDFRFGTVGKPLVGARLKINEEGEICVKGDMVFNGYLGKGEATESAFDSHGWYLTGDIGEFTKDGFLKITDRKKDIIVTSGGKNIAPQNIESLLQESPYIHLAMVHGDGRKFLSALLTLQWEAVESFAKGAAIAFSSRADLSDHPKVKELLQKEIDRCNERVSSFETIKKFAVLADNFSIETGELTPTLKVKRRAITEKYRNILDRFYS